ncbi:universal stress protein [Microvirga flavescens]|uniref:universal stress protein n=1 Tax=Microvirga flavescens TaxID=2249811 RepID=UPI0013009F45|nr:universal stress protein [Microvirga flavescens]
MIKDILVHLDGTGDDEVRIKHAEALAVSSQAYVTGLFTNPLPDFAAFASMDGGAGAAALLAQMQDDSRKLADEVLQRLTERFGKLAVPNEIRRIEDLPGQIADLVASESRWGDLTIVGQPYHGDDKADWDDLFESVLFESGRGVLVVPPQRQPADEIRRVLICWRDSREAARAVAEALPIIEGATRADILVIDPPRDSDASKGAAAIDIARHLDRHGTKVEITIAESGNRGISDVILDQARRLSADLIVMGGYGHSRAREWIMGGATRDMLSNMEFPILMAH